MFWRFGGYANISTLNNILEKPNVTRKEVLDESNLIQELKQYNFLATDFWLKVWYHGLMVPPVKPQDDFSQTATGTFAE